LRALRETAGWGLAIVVWATPLVAPILLIAWLAGDVPLGAALLTGLLALAWPGLALAASRLRSPDPLEIAEADGRRPVVLVHAFARSERPWYARLLVVSPGFWRDLGDHLLERALVRSLSHAGPVIPVARPRPGPASGPVRPSPMAGWEARLRRHLRRARLLAVVLDGRESDVRALAVGEAVVGRERVLLAPPARLDGAFQRRWDALREAAPGLPAIGARSVAFRYPADGPALALSASAPGLLARLRLLRQPSLLLRDGEATPAPRPPSYAPFLGLLAPAVGFVAAIAVPEMLSAIHGLHVGRDAAALGLLTVALGIAIGVSSLRVWRLVPGSELPLIALASAPWWGAELMRLDGASLSRRLKAGAVGAAYAAPLLFAVAVLLAAAALIRRAPHRRRAHAIFGLAAVVPFATLGNTLDDAHAEAALLGMAMLAAAFVLPLVFWAASGDAGRKHAPLPIGAAVAAGLALAAAGTTASHVTWRHLVSRAGDDVGQAIRLAGRAEALAVWADAWPWFVLAIPLAATTLAVSFRGRATPVSVGGLASLAPLLLLFALIGDAQAEAEARFDSAAARGGSGLLAGAVGEAAAERFALPTSSAWLSPVEEPAEIVLDRRGAVAGGQRVGYPGDLEAGFASGRLARAISDGARDGRLTVAAGADSPASALVGLALLGHRAGAAEVHLIARGPDGALGAVRFLDRRPSPGFVHWVLRIEHGGRYQLASTAGALQTLDRGSLAPALRERAQREASRVLLLAVDPGVPLSVALPAFVTASAHSPELALTR